MVKLNKIYTRTGDTGQTSIGDASRRYKNDPRVEAYGEVDAANAAIGVCCTFADSFMLDLLNAIQNDLFDLGADLCNPQHATHSNNKAKNSNALRITQPQIDGLESAIDQLNSKLNPLKSFVLPGGSPLAAALHVARTATRKAERDVVSLNRHEAINPHALRYLNRLSDLLFVMARYVNHFYATGDVLWEPGKNQ